MVVLTLAAGCGFQKVATHEPVVWQVEKASQVEFIQTLSEAMKEAGVPIATASAESGEIVSDSFEVALEFCDCGKNLLGADYRGRRRGLMRVRVRGSELLTVTFDFTTELIILANGKKLICSSPGVLEDRILTNLKRLTSVSVEKADE